MPQLNRRRKAGHAAVELRRDNAGVPHGDRGRIGVGAIDQHAHLRWAGLLEIAREISWNGQGDVEFVFLEAAVDIENGQRRRAGHKVFPGRQRPDVFTRELAFVVVVYRGIDQLDIGADRVPQNEQLDNRHEKDEPEHIAVAQDLQELLLDQRQNRSRHFLYPIFNLKFFDAAKSRMALKATRKIPSTHSTVRSEPLSMTPRIIRMK